MSRLSFRLPGEKRKCVGSGFYIGVGDLWENPIQNEFNFLLKVFKK
jgi:hypothetical protein